MKVHDLHHDIRELIDPQNRGRQFIASFLGSHTGTRLGGFVLTKQDPAGKWGTVTYALIRGDGREPPVGETEKETGRRDEEPPEY